MAAIWHKSKDKIEVIFVMLLEYVLGQRIFAFYRMMVGYGGAGLRKGLKGRDGVGGAK